MTDEHPETHPTGAPWRNFHGRIRGKTLRPRQKDLLETRLEALSPGPVSWEENPGRSPIDLAARFPGAEAVWLEVGFGGGEHLVHMAETYPGVAIIGAEPFINGVAMLLQKIEDAGASNIAIHPGDVRHLLDVIPEASLGRVFLNYPDPWPKQRHHKRRFVTQGHLQPLLTRMAQGAELRVATDIPDYVRQTLKEVPAAGFERVAHDISTPWADWPSTRYEQKALREGRTPHYLTFRRP